MRIEQANLMKILARKGEVITEWASETGKRVSAPKGTACAWCSRFTEVGCYTCINCGRKLNG